MISQGESCNNSGIEEDIAIVKGAILKKHKQNAAPKLSDKFEHEK
jgi:hypothetical protein